MKIHLIKKQTILLFASKHARSRASFEEWLTKVKYADWLIPSDIKKTFGKVDLLGKGSQRVVFDVGGNEFRMICQYGFGEKYIHLFVCWIGTHADYMKLCNLNQQYTINIY
jgi:mRNA interferase HigB